MVFPVTTCKTIRATLLVVQLLGTNYYLSHRSVVNANGYKIALVPKTTENPFFILAQSGCDDRIAVLNDNNSSSSCVYGGVAATEGNPDPDPHGELQADYVRQLLLDKTIDGMAVSVKNADLMKPIIDGATIPVITFDSDAPTSKRQAYVGTDNYFMGQTLAKVAQQIHPDGGTYAIVSSDDSPNIRQREAGFRSEMNPDRWTELSGSPAVYHRDLNASLDILEALSERNPTVIATTVGGAIMHPGYPEFWKRHAHQNLTVVAADDFAVQVAHLSRGYVHGLVGQMPYEMGARAVQVLHDLILQSSDHNNVSDNQQQLLGTNLITHVQVPLVLPELHVENNLIGNLRYVGYLLLSVTVITTIFCSLWTVQKRNQAVVQAAQPAFLIMVALGVAVLAVALVPLSMDDHGGASALSRDDYGNEDDDEHDDDDQRRATFICMSIPWLCCCGLTITFSALFSKTQRINRIVAETQQCNRVKVSPIDVLLPFVVVFTLNVVVLVLWTVVDPLIYLRIDNPGKDGWQRTISTYGACRCEQPWVFMGPLVLINLGLLLMANWQAYKSRKIRSEFSESVYIALCMAALLEALMIGLPILLVVRNSPQAFYLTMSFMLFVICMGVLLLIFIHKMVVEAEYSRRSQTEQKHMLLQGIRESVNNMHESATFSSPRSSGSKCEERGHNVVTTPEAIIEGLEGKTQPTDPLPTVSE